MAKNSREAKANKKFNMAIAIAVAIFLWVYVISEVNPLTTQTMTKIPVQLLNAQTIFDRGLAISGDQNFTIDVTLEGKRADIVKVTSAEIIANADLFGFGKGENYLTVTVSVPDGVKLKAVNPAKIKVVIEEMQTAKKDVRISYAGSITDGKEPGGIKINPSQLEVSGPASLVNSVDYINATVNMAELTTDPKTFNLKTSAMDALGNTVSNISISAETVQVSGEMLDVKQVKLVPVYTGVINANYDINSLKVPAYVSIKGSKDQLALIDSITTNPIDLSKLSPANKILISQIYPPGIEAARASEAVYAEVSVKDTITIQLSYDSTELQITGLDSNLNAAIGNTNIIVSVTGKYDVMSNLIKGDIVPYIDLTGAKASENNYNIVLKYTKGFDKTVVEPGVVHVTITAK